MWFAVIISLIFTLIFRALYVVIGRVGHYEIKRKAQLREPGSRTLYVLHGRGFEPKVGFLIWQILATSLFIYFLVKLVPLVPSILLAVVALAVAGEVFGGYYLPKTIKPKLDTIWPVLKRLLQVVSPISYPIGRFLDKRLAVDKPIIYSREHLMTVLEAHADSKISDVEQRELGLVKSSLVFGKKQVRSVMTSLDKLPVLERNTAVGPILLDELFASGFSWFAVRESAEGHVVGAVSLHKLTSMRAGGSVSGVLREDLPLLPEESLLFEAIETYEKTHETVFLVVNRFGDVVGLIGLEQVLRQLFVEPAKAPSEEEPTVVK